MSTEQGQSDGPEATPPAIPRDGTDDERSGWGWSALDAFLSFGDVIAYIIWGIIRGIGAILAALFAST